MPEDRPPFVPFAGHTALTTRIRRLQEERVLASAEMQSTIALIRATITRVREERLAGASTKRNKADRLTLDAH